MELLCMCIFQNVLSNLRIVVSNAYCVVFLFCFSSYCLPYAASLSGLAIFYYSNFYFQNVLYILPVINCIYNTYELRKVDV